MNCLRGRLSLGIFIAIIIALAWTPVGAQTTGSVVGNVKDSQGALIPGATVSLISETRGTTIDAQSTDVGAFEFTSVIADRYTLRITLQGFKTTERKNLDVSPGDRVVVGSISIAVGDLEETVIVSGEAPIIQAQTGRALVHRRARAGGEPAELGPELRVVCCTDPGRRQHRGCCRHERDRRRGWAGRPLPAATTRAIFCWTALPRSIPAATGRRCSSTPTRSPK